jgi:hypothetical protein
MEVLETSFLSAHANSKADIAISYKENNQKNLNSALARTTQGSHEEATGKLFGRFTLLGIEVQTLTNEICCLFTFHTVLPEEIVDINGMEVLTTFEISCGDKIIRYTGGV